MTDEKNEQNAELVQFQTEIGSEVEKKKSLEGVSYYL